MDKKTFNWLVDDQNSFMPIAREMDVQMALQVIREQCRGQHRRCNGCPLLTFSREEPYKKEEVCILDIDPIKWKLKGDKD